MESVEINRFPQECPHCHHTISPIFRYANRIDPQLELVFQCPNRLCNHFFISLYRRHTTMAKETVYNFYGPSNGTVMKITFSKLIDDISPHFRVLYSQARQAEYNNFRELSFAGYRLALECLVKDFLRQQHAERSKYISGLSLSEAILEFMEVPVVRKVASETAWLKSDELRMVTELNERDLMNLKLLTELMLRHIELEKLPEKFEQDFEQQSLLN